MNKGIGCMLFIAFLMPLELFAQFAGGSGTPGDPYQVATADQLNEVRNHLASHFIQTADIDLGGVDPAGDFYHSGLGWVPIGQFNNEFTGSYNGDGHTISGLYMQRIAAGVRAGLFGYIDTDALLIDIHLIDVNVTGNNPVGGLLGENSNGSVSKCSVTGTVAGVSNVGGLVGLNGSGNGYVSLSYANVAVSGTNSGVLVGNNTTGNVNSSFTEGSSPNASGGLVGRNNFGTVINSYSTVDGADGGLVGYNTGSVSVTYAAGTSDTGGLIAEDGGGNEQGNYWNTGSGSPDNGFGTGLTDTEMRQQANFTSWNFSTIWAIDEGVSYPYLKNNPPVIPVEAPVLVSPVDGTMGIEDSATLIWNAVPNADSYTLESSQAEDFSNVGELYLLEENITDTMLFIAALPPAKKLFWRVKTVSGEQESEWSEVFSFSSAENSLMPDPIALISPVDKADNLFPNVSLVWHSDVYADEYQIQVDTLEGFASPIADMVKADTGTTTGVLDEGTTYYWRVRGINQYGEAGWSQVFSFNTIKPLPDAPKLLSPADGATGIEDTLTIRWSAMENADSYNLEVSNAEDFNSEDNFLAEGLEDTTFFGDGLPPSVTFYWRVKAVIGNQESEWSEIFHFTTSSKSSKPQSISLIAPQNNVEDQPLEAIFLWNRDKYAEEYQFQLSQNASFSATVKDSVMNDTTLKLNPLDEGQVYFWRVRGKNVYLDGDWSDVFSFTTHHEISTIPTLVYPKNEASGLQDSVVFVWNSVANALNYEFQGSYVEDFSESVFGSDMLVDTTQTIHVFPPDQLFYWRVRAVFGSGAGEWSQVWSFKTSPTSSFPETPVLYLPEDQETDTELSLNLEWLPDRKSEQFALHVNYDVEISEDQNFSSLFGSFEKIQDTTVTIQDLDEYTKYYWRVRGNNDYGTGEWSDTWCFTTKLLSSGEENQEIPAKIALMQNYPNPFNPTTVIRYELPAAGKVDLRVFDLLGREVATLVDINYKPAGRYSVNFNAKNFPSGMYIYRLKAGTKVFYKKLTLIK